MEKFVGRIKELTLLKEFVEQPGSGFTYVRGRRRVGKSWLLKEFQKKTGRCFYFAGAADESNKKAIERFTEVWEDFSHTKTLSELQTSFLTWHRIFGEITEFLKKQKKTVILILDEIQWIAKKGSGFIGILKDIWVEWERLGRIKIIICGSSNKFFSDQMFGGEEKILRGLKTRSSIWVEPFTLSQVKKYFFREWSFEEVSLTYMMFGGIPYYLAHIREGLGFIHAINTAAFTENSVFLEEIDEILGLEFNKRGIVTIKKILATLGHRGTSWKSIATKTGIVPSTLTEVLERLVDYGIVYKFLPANKKPIKNEAGYRYAMKDFFMNFYFQVLEPLEARIKNNTHGLLFPYECLVSHHGYYIPRFSGGAFELLIRYILESKSLVENIFKKLQLVDENYTVETYWDTHTQIDLIVQHTKDRMVRIIECKWLSDTIDKSSNYISELLSKNYSTPSKYNKKYFLALSQECSKDFKTSAHQKGIEIIQLEDLFIT